MAGYFTDRAPVLTPTSSWGSTSDWSQTPVPDFEGYLPSLNNLGSSENPSPTQPGKQPGWGEQVGALLKGIGALGRGVGAGIAAAKGMPMAGMMLADYFDEKTGGQPTEDSLAKALKALREAGVISPIKLNVEGSTDLGSRTLVS